MKFIPEIILNLVAAFLGFIISVLYRSGSTVFRFRKNKKAWKELSSEQMIIVMGRFKKHPDFEKAGLISFGDAIALSELLSFLKENGVKNYSTDFSDRISGDDRKKNLILIGGPDANNITNETLKKISSFLEVVDKRADEINFIDNHTKEVYKYQLDSENQIMKDYGIILKADNPFSPKKKVFIIHGCSGFGTWAALRYAISDQFNNDQSLKNLNEFECLIEADICGETPQHIEKIVHYKIN